MTLQQQRTLFWMCVLLFAGLFIYSMSPVLMPFVAGLIIAYLLNPVVNRLQAMGFNRTGATFAILGLFLFLLVLSMAFAGPLLWKELISFTEKLPSLLTQLQKLVAEEGARMMSGYSGKILNKLGIIPPSPEDIQKYVGELAAQSIQGFGTFLRPLVTGGVALMGVFSFLIITPVVAFYLLLDWEEMIIALDGHLPRYHRGNIHIIAKEIDRVLGEFFRGQSLVCLILGLWYGLGFSLVGLTSGLLIGVVGGIVSFVPYVGAISLFFFGSILAIVQAWPDWKLFASVLAIVAAGQFLEGNILSPKLVGASVGLHPVWMMLSLFVFSYLFGFTGLLLAVPAAATIGVIWRFSMDQYRQSTLYGNIAQRF